MSQPEKDQTDQPFEVTAGRYLGNVQLRANLRMATHTIREKRAKTVAELDDWEQLREAGKSIKIDVMRHLDSYLLQLEASVEKAGGIVHWAQDAKEATEIISSIVRKKGVHEVVKVKSMTTEEIGLNKALEAIGVEAIETDLAELIVQLGHDKPSHILVPAIHKNKTEIRDLFARTIGDANLSDRPEELAETARLYLRHKFLQSKVGISGANFAIAETGTISIVESEGNGRMCTTLPETLISVMGIEKILPRWIDLGVFMQLLPRSSTAERMNPYNSFWTGVTKGDGPSEFHLVLLDNGRTSVLADETGRQALNCIRCSACLNVCPVYERTGGHAYHSVYPGPIGAILTPQLKGFDDPSAASLPYASSLCGACYEVCPVKINIPDVLLHLRKQIVSHKKSQSSFITRLSPERLAMKMLAGSFTVERRYRLIQKLGRIMQKPFMKNGKISRLPGMFSGWLKTRDMTAVAEQTFREWWEHRT